MNKLPAGVSVPYLFLAPFFQGLPEEDVLRVENLSIDGESHSLELRPHRLRSANFQLLVEDERGLRPVEAPPSRIYRGKIQNASGGEEIVTAALNPQGTLRMLTRHGGEWIAIERALNAEPGQELISRGRDMQTEPRGCAIEEKSTPAVLAPAPSGGGGNAALTAIDKVCKIAVDVDYEYFLMSYGGYDIDYTISDIESVIAGVEQIYEDHCGISYELTTIVIRTAEPDPYTSTTPATLLSQFRSYWNSNLSTIDRHVAHLFTGKYLSGNTIGYAYYDGICTSDAYGLSESLYTTNWLWRLGLTSHELGHNWNAQHCSGSGCNIMCPTIGGCSGNTTEFSQGEINQILAYKATRSCLLDYAAPYAMDPPLLVDHFDSLSLDSTLWTYNKGGALSTAASNEPSGTKSLCLNASGSGAYQDDDIRSNEMNIWDWDVSYSPYYQPLSVSFFSQHVGVEGGEDLVAEYFVPAWPSNLILGGWRELGRISSNGIDQTQFVFHQFGLPSEAYNWGFRIRLRPEVNQTNDNWYVDDFRIGPPLGPVAGAPNKIFAGTIFGEGLGSSVAMAGDVNQDGYADYILGSPYASQLPSYLNGKATIFSGKTGAVLREIWGNTYEGQFGWSVAGAGDWNADGFADVLVGEPGEFPSEGRALVISGADGATLCALSGDTPEDRFGWSVAKIGDVNGDGKVDIAVGAPGPNNAYSTALGYARVFAGGSGAQLYSWSGPAALSFFGYSVASAGDCNSDGRPDILIGAPKDAGNRGRVEVRSGATGALIRTFQGQFTGNFFGWSVDGLGDVDGDGRSEVAVGSPYESTVVGYQTGVVRVFKVNTGQELFAFYGEAANDQFGYSIAGIGDSNCDGKPDLLVGSPQLSGGKGYAKLFSGGDGSNLKRFLGVASGDQLGRAVCRAASILGIGAGGTLIASPGFDPAGLTGAGGAELRFSSFCQATKIQHP